jgi:hypothetical protein
MNDPWREYERMKGHKVYEFLIPVTKVIDWIKKRRKKQVGTEWAYDGCDCFPEDGYRAIPYCEKHFNKLYLKEV